MSWDVKGLFRLLAGNLGHSKSVSLNFIIIDVPNRKLLPAKTKQSCFVSWSENLNNKNSI